MHIYAGSHKTSLVICHTTIVICYVLWVGLKLATLGAAESAF